MKMRWAWSWAWLSFVAASVAGMPVLAQGPGPVMPAMGYPMPAGIPNGSQEMAGRMGGPPAGMPMPPPGYALPGMGGPGMGGGPGYGQPTGMMSPDAYGAFGASSPEMMYGGMEGAGGDGCPYCGGAGCDMCSQGHGHHIDSHGEGGLLGDVLGCVAPYPDGGCGAVRWFDFSFDVMALRRDSGVRNTDLTSLGISGPIVLSTDDFDFDDSEGGFRFTGQLQTGPGSSLEFTYYGLFYYEDELVVTRTGPTATDGLFSVFSQFGNVPLGGFDETDNADINVARYDSTFDNYEINFRQRWMAPNCRYQGSWLVGVRFFELDENFFLFTSSVAGSGDPLNPAAATFNTRTTNALTGIQIGGDVWVCLLPGLRLGAEVKGGVFGNHANADSNIQVNTQPLGINNPFEEQAENNDIAFVGNADLLVTYRVNQQWTLRGGYHFLYVDGVALAPENFNTVPPAIFFPPPGVNREAFINDNGNVFYHGFFAGAEFMW